MKATRNNSPHWYPMREPFETIAVDWDFTQEEFRKIEMGSIPAGFGDRYFIFLEDNCLYINYWSGEPLYMLWFKEAGDHYNAYQLQISKDPAVKEVRDNTMESRSVMGILMDDFNLYATRRI
jgi:hypothetical protein